MKKILHSLAVLLKRFYWKIARLEFHIKILRASLSRITGEDQLVTKGFVIPSTKWQFLGEINNQPNIKIPLYLDSSNGNNMLDISPWQTWSTKRTTLVNDSIISNSRIPIKTSPNSTQKSQSHDKRPSQCAHLQVSLPPSENIYFFLSNSPYNPSSPLPPSPAM